MDTVIIQPMQCMSFVQSCCWLMWLLTTCSKWGVRQSEITGISEAQALVRRCPAQVEACRIDAELSPSGSATIAKKVLKSRFEGLKVIGVPLPHSF
jgi:hypothetical protein